MQGWLKFILLIFQATLLNAQTELQWLKGLGSGPYDHCSGIVFAGNSLYVCGYSAGMLNGQTSVGVTDGFIAKYDKSGNLIWQKRFGGMGEDRPQNLCYDALNNRILITGFFDSKLFFGSDSLVSMDKEDIFLLAVDSNGNWQWGKSFGGTSSQSSSCVLADADGNISLTGYFEDTLVADTVLLVSRGNRNAYLLHLDASGNCLWGKRMGGSKYDEGLNIVSDANKNLYLSGYYRDTADFGPFVSSSVYTYDCFLVSLTKNGDWRWFKSFGGGYVDNCPALTYLPKSSKIVAGGWFFNDISFGADTTLFSSGEEESFLASFDTSGSLLWTKRIGKELSESIYDLTSDEEDNIIAIGTFDSIIVIGLDTLIAKHYNKPSDLFILGFSAEGKYRWGTRAGAEFSDFGYHIAWGDSSTFYVGGNFLYKTIFETDTLYSLGNYDIYFAKYFLDTLNLGPTSVQIQNGVDPDFKIYPNPFKDNLIIERGENSDILKISIYNLLGQLFFSEFFSQDSIVIDLSLLGKAIYIIKIEDASSKKTSSYRIIKN
jgi:hypothetical protein